MPDRLNKAAQAYHAWTKADKERFAAPFNGTVKDIAPAAPRAPVEIPAQAGITPEEAMVPAMQEANAGNPSIQDKLNMLAKARAKFYAQPEKAPVAEAPADVSVGQRYSAMER